ncbi:MAG: molybdopterin molybdotransferase MoeA [Candidatus Marinimicrobia bacterium]|nr:molybdopterin molybdotransferase MoeA [Candidatus Neomarinimicrobiota bacterium]
MISVEKAHRIIQSATPDPLSETVQVKEASDRVLARDVFTPFAQPRFDNSAMDGFALRWEDTVGASQESPVGLTLKGTISAGVEPEFAIQKGECCQIMTGAPVPGGANAIVIVENTSGFSSNNLVQIFEPAALHNHIRFQGEEIQEGELLLKKGTHIGPSELNILVAFGYGEVPVYQRLKIAIFTTGNELIEPGNPLKVGQIYNSNLHLLTDLAKRVGPQILFHRVIRDDPESMRELLSRALDSCDIVVTSGGVSKGKYDYVREVFSELGVKEHFRRVAQKPGKPFLFGTKGEILIFGLPGNPVSSFICFMEFVWLTCEHWMGLKPLCKVKAILKSNFPNKPDKHCFLFGRLSYENNRLMAVPTEKYGSHMVTSAVDANCILESPPGSSPLQKGDTILANPFPWMNLGRFMS